MMDMPDVIKLGYFYAPAPMSEYYYCVMDEYTKATPEQDGIYHHDRVLKAKDAEIAMLQAIIESRGM